MTSYQKGFADARHLFWAALSTHLNDAEARIELAREAASWDWDESDYQRGYAEASIIAAGERYPVRLIVERIAEDYPTLAEYVPALWK